MSNQNILFNATEWNNFKKLRPGPICYELLVKLYGQDAPNYYLSGMNCLTRIPEDI